MFSEIFKQAWTALGRNPVRSFLTMPGISWGIVAVTLLLSYGAGFRSVLMYTFEVFGKGAVIAWPGTTSEQAGGERAGKAGAFRGRRCGVGESAIAADQARHSRNRAVPRHFARRAPFGHRGSRRLSRIRRNAQRSSQRWPLDFRGRYCRAPPRGFSGFATAQKTFQRRTCSRRNGSHQRRPLHRNRFHGQKIFRQLLFQLR